VLPYVASAVAKAAIEDGVARIDASSFDEEKYFKHLEEMAERR
jgi:malic enzyme